MVSAPGDESVDTLISIVDTLYERYHATVLSRQQLENQHSAAQKYPLLNTTGFEEAASKGLLPAQRNIE
jgi:hypothetical protein